MGVFTRQYQEKVDSIVTECYVYAPSDLSGGGQIKRVKIQRSLWDTGASVSLVSARVAKVLGLVSIGKSGVSGYHWNGCHLQWRLGHYQPKRQNNILFQDSFRNKD